MHLKLTFILSFFQVKHDSKEKLPLSGGKQMQFSSNVEKNDFGLISGISRLVA